MQRLETTEIVQIDYMPKQLVTNCKETQTAEASNLSEGKTQYTATTSIQQSCTLLLIPVAEFAAQL